MASDLGICGLGDPPSVVGSVSTCRSSAACFRAGVVKGYDRMTYRVGDTVVYPHHGAAVIEKREKRTLAGQERDYLVLRLTYGDLTLMVPADATDEVGLRDVV